MKYYFVILIFSLGLVANASNEGKIKFVVEKVAEIPSLDSQLINPGLAGAFSGVINDKLIVAGGANFPGLLPWNGGQKVFHNKIFTFQIENEKINPVELTGSLPNGIAYGNSISLSDGVLCIGGNNSEQCFSKVYLIQLKEGEYKFEDFPGLPVALSYSSCAYDGKSIYLIGGSEFPNGTGTKNYFLRLDLSKRGSLDFAWEVLPPYPGPARILPVTVIQSSGVHECVYVFSGRNIDKNGKVTILKDGMYFDPVLNTWSKILADEKTTFPFMAGSAFPLGANNIVFLGGASGELFIKDQTLKQKIELANFKGDSILEKSLKKEKIEFLENHPGFSKEINVYNTITGEIYEAGKFDDHCPVTTNLVKLDDSYIMTSGEIRPGVRTPDIYQISEEFNPLKFGWLNYIVLFIYFLVLVLIGFIFSKKQKSTDDYFKGGGRIPWWAAGLSLFGTALSAITFMAVPAKTYATDWSYFAFNMSIFLVAPIVIVLFISFYRRLNVTTAYEYLEKRYNVLIRLIGSISFIVFQIGRMGVVLLLPSLALNVVTGADVFLCIILMGIVSLIYTLMGGIEAVIWTDVIQVIVLLLGAVMALVVMIVACGGNVGEMYETALNAHKFNLIDLRSTLKEPTVWVMLIGGLFTNITTYGTDQTMVQRYLTTQTEKEARQSIWTNAWLTIPASILFFSIGTALFVFYRTYPELNNPILGNTDSIFPWFIVSELPNGLSGLLIAGIFAAAMSSLSSSINSGATAYSTDIHFRFSLTSKTSSLKIARVASLVIGLAGTLFALFMATWNIQSLWDEFNRIIGLLIGSLGGLFLLGILTKRANSSGALIGIIISIIVQIIVARFHVVHLLLYTATGVISCFAFGYVASLFFSGSNKSQEGLTVFKN